MATLTVKERQHLAREEAIVETAYDMLAEQGYERMSMDDLAKRVGIAKATLYQHFPSKEDVLVGVIVNFMRRGEAALLDESDVGLPPIQRLERGLRRCMLDRIRLSRGNVAIHPVNLKSHPRYCEQHEHLFQRITEVIEQSKAAGEINPALATPVIVHTIMWLFRIDYQALMTIKGCTSEQAVDSLVTIVINGLKTAQTYLSQEG